MAEKSTTGIVFTCAEFADYIQKFLNATESIERASSSKYLCGTVVFDQEPITVDGRVIRESRTDGIKLFKHCDGPASRAFRYTIPPA